MSSSRTHTWLDQLSDEDVAFIRRFVLASGSLKAVAADYGVSYPTVRLRLDRLINKIRIAESQEIQSRFERTARMMYADGHFDMATLKALIAAQRENKEPAGEQA